MQLRKEHGYRNRDTFAAELGIPANTLDVYKRQIISIRLSSQQPSPSSKES